MYVFFSSYFLTYFPWIFLDYFPSLFFFFPFFFILLFSSHIFSFLLISLPLKIVPSFLPSFLPFNFFLNQLSILIRSFRFFPSISLMFPDFNSHPIFLLSSFLSMVISIFQIFTLACLHSATPLIPSHPYDIISPTHPRLPINLFTCAAETGSHTGLIYMSLPLSLRATSGQAPHMESWPR